MPTIDLVTSILFIFEEIHNSPASKQELTNLVNYYNAGNTSCPSWGNKQAWSYIESHAIS